MHIDSQHVGTQLRTYQTIVTARQAANYAAAVGDSSTCYFDDTRPDGIIAHPVFPVAVTWPITSHLDRYIEDNHFPLDLMAMQVHHTEHIALHRPVRPGQELVVTGAVAAILPHRAGTRVVLRYEARDQDRRPVFTEHIGGLLRDVHCTDEGQRLPGLPADPPPDSGQEPIWQQEIDIDPLLPYIYDGCSDIVFPIHTSPAFARQVGLPGILLQGTATLALAVREVFNRENGLNPSAATAVACRFTGMVIPGDSIVVRLRQRSTANGYATFGFDVVDSGQRPVLRKGLIECRTAINEQEN